MLVNHSGAGESGGGLAVFLGRRPVCMKSSVWCLDVSNLLYIF